MSSERQVSKKRKPRFSYRRFYCALLRVNDILSFEHVRSSACEIDILVDDAVIDALRLLLPIKEICEIYYVTSLFYFKATCFVPIEIKSAYLERARRYISHANLLGFYDKNNFECMIKSYSSAFVENGLAGENVMKYSSSQKKAAISKQFFFFREFAPKINRSIYGEADKLFSEALADFEKKIGGKYFSLNYSIGSSLYKL